MSERKRVEIAYITDSNYVLPTRVSITSLIKNSGDDHEYIIHVVGDGLEEGKIKELEDLSSLKGNANVNVIKVENDYGELYKEHQHVSKAALLKFSLADIFNDVDKILYLDGDTLILGDIAELYDIDISGYFGAAVCDAPTVIDQKSNERIGHNNYFNSGVMLLDLSKWRGVELKSSLIKEKEKDEWGHFVDQDAFNTVLGGKIRYLSLKYNCIYDGIINKPIEQIAGLFQISIDDAKKQIDSPIVLHLANKKKPWNNIGASKFEEWMNYYGSEVDRDFFLNCIINFAREQEEVNAALKEEIRALKEQDIIISDNLAYYRDRTLYGIMAKIKRKLFG